MLSFAGEIQMHMPMMLTICPFLLLIAGAFLARYLYLRGYRNAWMVTLIISFLAWGLFLLLGVLPAAEFHLSIGSEGSSLYFSFDFRLDDDSWRMGVTGLTILIAVLLLELSRAKELRAAEQPFLMAFGALAGLSILSASLLALILTWTAVDVALIGHLSRRGSALSLSSVSRSGLGMVIVRTGLLMGSLAVGNGTHLGAGEFGELRSPLAWLLFVAAICSRAIWRALGDPWVGAKGRRSWVEHFATASFTGLALLAFARMLQANPLGHLGGWVSNLGVAAMMGGGLGVALGKEVSDGRPWLALGVTGLGIYLGAGDGALGGTAAVNIGLTGMLVGSILMHAGPFANWERRWMWLAALIFAGLPPFIGMPGATLLGDRLRNGPDPLAAALALTGYGLITSAMLRSANRQPREWLSEEDLSRVFYAAGLVFPALPLLGFGLQATELVSTPGVLLTLVVVAIGIGVADLSLRYDIFPTVERWGKRVTDMGLRPVSSIGRVLETGAEITRGAIGILEGEGALIWLFVIILFLGLVIGSGAM